MQKIILALFFAVIAVSVPVLACGSPYDHNVRSKASLSMKWFKCKADSDCALAVVPCMASIAINSSHKTEAEPILCKAYNNCIGGCDKSMEDTSGASCIDHKCVTILGMKKPKMDVSPAGFELKDLHAVPAANPN